MTRPQPNGQQKTRNIPLAKLLAVDIDHHDFLTKPTSEQIPIGSDNPTQ
jgi:hypothetical protein